MLMSMDLPEPIGPKLFILGEPVLRKYYCLLRGVCDERALTKTSFLVSFLVVLCVCVFYMGNSHLFGYRDL